MTILKATNPLPAGYGPEGLDRVIREKFGCESRWVEAFEVSLGMSWIGFVHQFDLIEHRHANSCFVVPVVHPGAGTIYPSYLQDARIKDAEDAARWAYAQILKDNEPDRVSTSSY